VDGIDWEVAWMHLSDEQLLKDTLRDFYEMLPVHGKNLDEMLKRFPSEEAVEEYRILVHAMKGLSAMLGIFTLAGMAKVLEYAAHDKELETIYAIHSIFLKEWYAYEEKLRGIFGLGEETDEEKPQYESAKVKAYFNLLKQALEEMEVDEADRLVKELSDYAYPPKILTKIKELHQAVTGLDEEKADDIMDEILSQL
jgi:chemotaxis protein histidine kinase CheA